MPQSISPSRTSPIAAARRQWAALAILTLAVVLLAVDGTVLYLAVPALTAALDPSAVQVLWIGDVYSFALAGLLVTMGNVADRIGRKKLLLIGAVGFGIASAVAAFAPSAEMLIAARALLGISGATIMPSTLSLVRNIFTDARQRTRAIAIWSAGATGGAALGPLVGGALLENFWWGSVFLINIPVMVVLLIGGILLLPESKNPDPAPLDLVSALLSIMAIVPVVYAVKTLASEGLRIEAALGVVVGVLAGLIFVRRQKRIANPLLDVDLFRRPAFSGAVAANTIAIFAFTGLLFFFSQYLQLVRGFGPLQAGIAELPSTVASIAVIAVIGIIVTRLGRGPSIAAGLALSGVGLVTLAIAEGLPGYLWIALALVIIGFGVSIAATVSTDAVMAAVPPQRAGAASSVAETAYELGIALGIAVLGSIHTGLYRIFLLIPEGTSAEDRSTVTESLAAATRTLRADGTGPALDLLASAQHAFTMAMQISSIIAAVLVLVAAVIAWRAIPAERRAPHPTHDRSGK